MELSLDRGPTSTVGLTAVLGWVGGGLLGPRQLDAAQTPLSAADKPCKVAQLHSWMIDPEAAPENCSLFVVFPFTFATLSVHMGVHLSNNQIPNRTR